MNRDLWDAIVLAVIAAPALTFTIALWCSPGSIGYRRVMTVALLGIAAPILMSCYAEWRRSQTMFDEGAVHFLAIAAELIVIPSMIAWISIAASKCPGPPASWWVKGALLIAIGYACLLGFLIANIAC